VNPKQQTQTSLAMTLLGWVILALALAVAVNGLLD
jgi:hypothetical protein